MIWNTVRIWLIGVGVLAGMSLFTLLVYQDILALLIAPISFSVFVFPLTGAVCGYRAAAGQADIATALLIEVSLGVLFLCGLSDGFQLWSGKTLLSFAPVLATGISFGLCRLLEKTKPLNPVFYRGSLAATLFICAMSLYLLGAFQSQMAYLSLPTSLFYVRPENSRTAVHVENDTANGPLLYSDETQEPFDGKIVSYRERLTLNFFTKTPGGVSSYIHGLRFGTSGDVVSPEYDGNRPGAGVSAEEWRYGEQAAAGQTYLLHRDYQRTILGEFPRGAAVYYGEEPAFGQEAKASPLPKGVAIFSKGNKLLRKEITYHPNGVADWIEVYANSGFGWERVRSIHFDALGYNCSDDGRTKWREQDFLPVAFDSPGAVRETFDGATPISQHPKSMEYVPYPENWDEDGNLVDNLISVYGFPLTTVYLYIGSSHQDFTPLEIEEGANLLSLMGESTLTLRFLETEDQIDAFQSDAVRFLITSDEAGKRLTLFYGDGRILIEDGPYYLDLLAEAEKDGEEDGGRFQKNLQSFLGTLKKYGV